MYKIDFIGVIFIIMLMSAASPSFGAGRDCYIGTERTDLWGSIEEAAGHPDKLLMINNIEDRKAVSDIFKKLVTKKGEMEIKIKEGDDLVKKYEELKNTYDDKAKLEKKLQEQYDQLSYAEVTKLRSEIQIKKDELVNIYEKGKFRKLADVTAELKIIVTDMAGLQKELLNNIDEINNKQQGLLFKSALFGKITEIRCEG